MKKFQCLIVDDEPLAREIIRNYCAQLPYLEVLAECGNALEAKNALLLQHADLLFLDIHLPVLDGISFLKTVKNPPRVIFTTAYKEYAVTAFELSADDYLVKPFSLERFITAVDKALEKHPGLPTPMPAPPAPADDHCFIRSEGKIYKLLYGDCLYAEARGNYTRIVSTQHTLLPAMSFTSVEAILPASSFIRVHRSFIVNKARISHIEGNQVYIQHTAIPISSNYKEAFLKALGL